MSDAMSHDEATAQLPWLVNGTLDAEGQRAVQKHVRSCAICRRELDELAKFAAIVADEGDNAPLPRSDMHRINARIDADVGQERRKVLPWVARKSGSCVNSARTSWLVAFAVLTAVVLGIVVALFRWITGS